MEKVNVTLGKDQYAVFNQNGRNSIITSKMLNLINWLQIGFTDQPLTNGGIKNEMEENSKIYDCLVDLVEKSNECEIPAVMDSLYLLRHLRNNIKTFEIPKEIYSQPNFKL